MATDNPKVVSAYSGAPAIQNIPTNLRVKGVMSDTSSAAECFIDQRFSAQLQAFLISYNTLVFSNYSIYGA